jgi:aminoglycoside phosphotransferase (APT) family kinase protein
MQIRKMHDDEVGIDVALVRRLVGAQFPNWAALPIEPVPFFGTDNAIYRLGTDMTLRLPRREQDTGRLQKERRWLPRLAPLLPLDVPVPLAAGEPAEGYPFAWSIYRWLEGEAATVERIGGSRQAAVDLAGFIAALQRVDPTDGPPPGEDNAFRGEPLAARGEQTVGRGSRGGNRRRRRDRCVGGGAPYAGLGPLAGLDPRGSRLTEHARR